MPVKIARKTSYSVDIKIPSLDVDKHLEVDEKQMGIIYGEIDDLCKSLADACGAIRLPTYKTPHVSTAIHSEAEARLIEHAGKTDFTIKSASEALHIPEPTLWAAANRLVEKDLLTKTSVGSGVAHLYSLVHKRPPEEKLVVLPNGKESFPTASMNPERERMQSQH